MEHEIFVRIPIRLHLLENYESRVGERHAMLLTDFHPIARHYPNLLGFADFLPNRANRLSSARCSQYCKLESPSGDASLASEGNHKVRQLPIWQRRVVFYLPHLGSCRQEFAQVPAPPGRVVALAIAAHGCPIEHRFDTAP